MIRSFYGAAAIVLLLGPPAMAAEKPGSAGRPADVDVKPEITKQLPKDVKSLRADPDIKSGPGNLVKSKGTGPVLDKNTNTGNPKLRDGAGGATTGLKTSNKENALRTDGETTSGPGDKFKKKGVASSRKNARSGSDEGGDVEDLELQR